MKESTIRVVSTNILEFGITAETERRQRQRLRGVMGTVSVIDLLDMDKWFTPLVELLEGFLENHPPLIGTTYECIYALDGKEVLVFDLYYGIGGGLAFTIKRSTMSDSYGALSSVVFSGEVASGLTEDFKVSYNKRLSTEALIGSMREMFTDVKVIAPKAPVTTHQPAFTEVDIDPRPPIQKPFGECPHCSSRIVLNSNTCIVCNRDYLGVYDHPVTLGGLLSFYGGDLSETDIPFLGCNVSTIYLELSDFIDRREGHDCVPPELKVLCESISDFYEVCHEKFASHLQGGRLLNSFNERQYFYRESSKLLTLVDAFLLASLEPFETDEPVEAVTLSMLDDAFEDFNRYFTSGNSVPVDQKVTVDKDCWFKLRTIYRQLKPNLSGSPVSKPTVSDEVVAALKAADEAVQDLVDELVDIVKPTKH